SSSPTPSPRPRPRQCPPAPPPPPASPAHAAARPASQTSPAIPDRLHPATSSWASVQNNNASPDSRSAHDASWPTSAPASSSNVQTPLAANQAATAALSSYAK